MNPLLLLVGAVAFLAFSKKSTTVIASTTPTTIPATPKAATDAPVAPITPTPTFTDVAYAPKAKEPIATTISAIGPSSGSSMPPYVDEATPTYSGFGVTESERML